MFFFRLRSSLSRIIISHHSRKQILASPIYGIISTLLLFVSFLLFFCVKIADFAKDLYLLAREKWIKFCTSGKIISKVKSDLKWFSKGKRTHALFETSNDYRYDWERRLKTQGNDWSWWLIGFYSDVDIRFGFLTQAAARIAKWVKIVLFSDRVWSRETCCSRNRFDLIAFSCL